MKLINLIIANLLIALLLSCNSNKTDVNQIKFKTIDGNSRLYTYKVNSIQKSLIPNASLLLSAEASKILLPKNINLEKKTVYALDVFKGKNYIIRTFIIRDPTTIENDAFLYFDQICLVIYDSENNIKDFFYNSFFPDEYGSYNEIEITSSHQIVIKLSDWEYSPDEESEKEDQKNGYKFHPDVYSKTHKINNNTLTLESIKENVYPDPYY